MGLMVEKGFEYFLNHDFADFKDGEWVAIFGDRVVSHGEKLKVVIEKAKEIAPLSNVLFSKVKRTASFL